MDNDRKLIESLRSLQNMENLSEEEFIKRKDAIMRKLTQQATKFLYEKEENEAKDAANDSIGKRKLF